MKKLCLVIACAALLLYACVSNKQLDVIPAGPASISATVDGVTENFTASDSIGLIGTERVLISGTNPANNDHIILTLDKLGDTVDAGSYSSDYIGADNIRACAIHYYFNRDSTKYPNTGVYYTLPAGPTNARYPGTVVVTALNDTLFTGTFNGTLLLGENLFNGKPLYTKTVTNGVFSINFRKVPIAHLARKFPVTAGHR